ncbi:MAG TPA: cytochrome c3 family protein [Pirellulales bacterium]|nr:cytochrome c3 family protein [Pirellulales bacterium]
MAKREKLGRPRPNVRQRHGVPKRLLAAVATVAFLAGGVCLWQTAGRRYTSSEEPLSASTGALKTASAAEYVGMAKCAGCHAEQVRGYRQSAHSLALADIDAAVEPPDAQFYHEASGRTYTVYRQGDQFRHREAIFDDDGEIAAADYPVRYLIGSGRHSRSYLVEIDGFLCESPLTWYASRQSWGVSPGYDRFNPRGFERAAEGGCLFCHVGRVANAAQDYQRLQIVEQPIGCERCHGPASLHVARQQARLDRPPIADGAPDIINPADLPRDVSEAVCAQCHLNTDAQALVRGTDLSDYRPGMALTEFCVNYRRDDADSQMKVVGHVEQMHLSRCYQASQTLTCTTCHDPHAPTELAQQRPQFIRACLSCHDVQSCGLALDDRLQRSSGNDCVTCHMPQVETEIPHIAFTRHRIGTHGGRETNQPHRQSAEIPGLVPFETEVNASGTDHARNLGLAYFSLSQKETDPGAAEAYRQRARDLLESVRAKGAGHREVAAALVRLYRSTDPDGALRLAHEALAAGGLAPRSQVNCLFLIAEMGGRVGDYRTAMPALQRLTEIRLLSEDWLLMGLCHEQVSEFAAAKSELERAEQLAPLRPEIHETLAEVLRRLGQNDAAEREHSVAVRLIAHTEKLP